MATIKPFDVRKGLTVNGLEFVDENRNVTLNNLTVKGVSTVVNTKTVTTNDPIIELGSAGTSYSTTGISSDTSYLLFPPEAIADFATGDRIRYSAGNDPLSIEGTVVPDGTEYYIKTIVTDKNDPLYGGVQVSETLGGAAVGGFAEVTPGGQSFQLNPIDGLVRDLGITFNYLDSSGSNQKGFFGYKDSYDAFTLLEVASEASGDIISGTKGTLKIAYLDLALDSKITVSKPALKIAQIWEEGTTAFNGIDVTITDTASNSISSILNFATVTGGSTSNVFHVRKNGYLGIGTSTLEGALTIAAGDTGLLGTGVGNGISLTQTWALSPTAQNALKILVDAQVQDANNKLINVATNAGTSFVIDTFGKINSAITFNDTAPAPADLTALKLNVTNTASGTGSKLLDLQVGGASKFSVDLDGDIATTGSLTVAQLTTTESFNLQGPRTPASGDPITTDISSTKGTIKEIAAGSAITVPVFQFATAEFKTAKFVIQARITSNGDLQSTEVLVNHKSGTVYLTEYGSTSTNTSGVGTIDAEINGDNLFITFTNSAATAALNSTVEVTTVATLIK